MLFTFFVFGTLWWWALFTIAFIGLIWAVEEENGPWAFVLLFGFVAVIHLLGDANFLPYIKANPKLIFLGIFAYFAIGFAWSIGKYSFKMGKIKSRITALREEFEQIQHKDPANLSAEQVASAYEDFVRRGLDYRDYEYATQFSKSTGKVIFWATYWPWSMLWTLLDDPIRKMFTFIYEHWIKGMYKAIHNKTFGNALKW